MTDTSSRPTPLSSSARAKILSLEQMAAEAVKVKAKGGNVIHAHGVFDLIHLGHVRHLEAARREGNGSLFVTITPDKYVNKGPGRPVFNEQLRAEMLASLVYVDWVAINDTPTAEKPLQMIKPDLYVKGSDYKNADQDVTGKIVAEQEMVEAHGGKVLFTDEISYSSSSLINQHLNIYDQSLSTYLTGLRNAGALDTMLKEVERTSDLKVLVIGDCIIDDYQYVSALGKPSKESIVSTLLTNREVFAGGVIAAANHAASFCKSVEIMTSLGGRESFEDTVRASLKSNVTLTHIVREEAPTTRKTRFVDLGYSMRKLFEVYVMDDSPLSDTERTKFDGLLAEKLKQYDIVIVTDFGHGLLSGSTIQLLLKQAKFLAVNTQTNSGNHGFNLVSKYARADYVCLDGAEARLAVHEKHASLETILAESLPKVIDCNRMIITQGKHGCLTLDQSGHIHRVPALTSTIVDTVGAGDAFFAVTAPMAALGLPMPQVGFVGNAAGAIKVGIVGHRTAVEKASYIKFITALLK